MIDTLKLRVDVSKCGMECEAGVSRSNEGEVIRSRGKGKWPITKTARDIVVIVPSPPFALSLFTRCY